MSHYVTQEGLKKIQEELTHLEGEAMKQVIERIAAAKELGDLKENSEYSAAKEEQGLLVSRIAVIKSRLKDIVVIEESKDRSKISIGSTIVVQSPEKREFTFTIVGVEEAEPSKSKISYESPMGKAFLNKKKGETANVMTPKGVLEYTVTEIK